jgi:threonine/homoserine/homoserine lactone efflux protein
MSLMMNTVFVSLELRRPRTVTPCDRITGGVFVSFGLKLVFDTRALVKN